MQSKTTAQLIGETDTLIAESEELDEAICDARKAMKNAENLLNSLK